MKFVNLKAIAIALAVSTAMAGGAHAQIASGTSDPGNVLIDVSTVVGGPHSAGKVGINVPNLTSTQYVDFQGLQAASPPVGGVTSISAVTGTVTDHSQFGRFDFAKVSGHDLYFGEWKQTASVTAGDHTVYYGGTGASVVGDIPGSGGATYTVKGISDFANTAKGLLSGTFTASFFGGGTGTLTGDVRNGANTYIVDIGTAGFAGSTAITGSTGSVYDATAGGTPITVSGGAVNGQFFGTGLSALAGTVAFSGNRHYDTAFGGTKN